MNINYFSEHFNSQKLTSYILNVELSKWGIKYSIFDNIRNLFVAIVSKDFENPENDILDNLQKFIIEDVYLNKHYKSINFNYSTSDFTIVPIDFFDKNEKKQLLQYCTFDISEKDEVLFTNIDDYKLTIIFSYPSKMLSFLINQYPEVRFYHISYNMFSSLKFIEQKTNQKTTLIHIFPNFLIIGAIDRGKLICFNHYSFENQIDAVYYIFNIIDKFGLNDSNIYFEGSINNASEIYSFLRKNNFNIRFRMIFEHEVNFKNILPHEIATVLNVFQ